ncbi:hypothetical protein QAD02_009331 [Eretmocerus hayati]|uniref:Uncharacterized protein n=1 Tax=Eretmocerus hayati TaxID=131215 RepID=A0ACC2NA95_9HYME|nr:hypothetical protein QAD02_009331 [Eretmocerus hayati]
MGGGSLEKKKEIIDDFTASLSELTTNKKPLISMLTILAEDYIEHAHDIVTAIEEHVQKVHAGIKLPILYLIDSIVKSVNRRYLKYFSKNIVHTFSSVFEQVDENTRACMWKLRDTWNDVFSSRKLLALDIKVNQIDPAWPIPGLPPGVVPPKKKLPPPVVTTVQPPPIAKILPAVKAAPSSEVEMQEKLLQKQRELLELQKQKIELELLQTQASLDQQRRQLGDNATQPKIELSSSSSNAEGETKFSSQVLQLVKEQCPESSAAIASAISSRDPRLKSLGLQYALKMEQLAKLSSETLSKTVNVAGERSDLAASNLSSELTTRIDETDISHTRSDTFEDENDSSSRRRKSRRKSRSKYLYSSSSPSENLRLDESPVRKRSKKDRKGYSPKPVSSVSKIIHSAYHRKRKRIIDPELTPRGSNSNSSGDKSPRDEEEEEYDIEDGSDELLTIARRINSKRKGQDGDKDPDSGNDSKDSTVPEAKQDEDLRMSIAKSNAVLDKKDLDLRVHDAPGKKQQSSISVPLNQKTKTGNFDELFGSKDVDLRTLPNSASVGRPSSPSFRALSKTSSWAMLKTPPSKTDSRTSTPSSAVKDRLGRPRLHGRLTISSDDPSDRPAQVPAIDDRSIEIIIKQAAEQLNQGTISKIQYNDLIQQILKVSEDQKLKAAQRQEQETGFMQWEKAAAAGPRPPQPGTWPGTWPQTPWGPSPFPGAFPDATFRGPMPPPPPWVARPFGPPPPPLPPPPLPPPFFGPQIGPLLPPPPPPAPLLLTNESMDSMDLMKPLEPPPSPPQAPATPAPIAAITSNNLKSPNSGNQIIPGLTLTDDEIQRQEAAHAAATAAARASGSLPPPDPKLVQEIIQDTMKSIHIDGTPREVRYYGSIGVVFMSWDDPRDIGFQSGSRNVIIDDGNKRDLILCNFNEDYREFTFEREIHRLKLGTPTRELYVNDKWYEAYFGGQPIRIDLGNRVASVTLEGPIPSVRIGSFKRSDLVLGKINLIINATTMVPVFLDAKPQLFEIEGEKCTLEFADALQTVLLNGIPFRVEFGGLPKPIMLAGKKHFIRFTPLPPGFHAGYVKITGMRGEPPKESRSIFDPNNKALSVTPTANPTVLPGLGPDADPPNTHEVPPNKPVSFSKPDSLKSKNPSVVKALYSGMQCSSCGTRFAPEEAAIYSHHLDWHFRQNRRERGSTKKPKSRAWYYEISDWIQFEEIEDLDGRAQPWFETDRHVTDETNKNEGSSASDLPSLRTDSDNNSKCEVCQEPFEQFFHEEKEEWHIRPVVIHEEKKYHPICLKDFQRALQQAATAVEEPVTEVEQEVTETRVIEEVTIDDDDDQVPSNEKESEEIGELFEQVELEDQGEHEEESVDEQQEPLLEEQSEEMPNVEEEIDEKPVIIKMEVEEDNEEEGEEEEEYEEFDPVKQEPPDVDIKEEEAIEDQFEEVPEIEEEMELEDPDHIEIIEPAPKIIEVAEVEDSSEDEAPPPKVSNGRSKVPEKKIEETVAPDIPLIFENVTIKEEPDDDDIVIIGHIVEPKGVDTTQVAVKSSIDGNVELDSARPTIRTSSSKIKLNITKSASAASKDSSKDKQPHKSDKQAEKPSAPPKPLIPAAIKPGLQGKKLSILPTVDKGHELSGLCSVM